MKETRYLHFALGWCLPITGSDGVYFYIHVRLIETKSFTLLVLFFARGHDQCLSLQ